MNGAMSYSVMGSTDGSGNFSKSGQITADQVGTWQETWGVGDPTKGPAQSVGFIAFTVQPPSQALTTPPAKQTTGGGGTTIPSTTGGGGGTTTTTPPGTFDIGSFLTGSAFMGIPNWMLLAGAGGLVLFMGGRH